MKGEEVKGVDGNHLWDKKHNCDLLSDLWKSQMSYSGLETNTVCSHTSRAAQLRCLQLAEEKCNSWGSPFYNLDIFSLCLHRRDVLLHIPCSADRRRE